jgi:hypothetical protein
VVIDAHCGLVLRSWQANLNPGAVDDYDAECDVLSPDRIEFLTRAVILVAGRCRRRVASYNSFGEDFVYASKRCQGGKVETYSDLVSCFETAEAEEVFIAVVRSERDQQQQRTGQKR